MNKKEALERIKEINNEFIEINNAIIERHRQITILLKEKIIEKAGLNVVYEKISEEYFLGNL